MIDTGWLSASTEQISTYERDGHTYIRAQNGGYTVIADDYDRLARAFTSYEKEYRAPVWKAKEEEEGLVMNVTESTCPCCGGQNGNHSESCPYKK